MKTIRKAIAVLSHLSTYDVPLGVTEIATATGIEKSIAHRILKTLEEAKLVHQDASTRKYSLGIGFLQMGQQFLHKLQLPELVHPHLLQLWELTNETVNCCVLSELETVIVRAYESRQGVRVSAGVGSQASLHATASGKVFLAFGSPELLERAIQAGLTQYQPQTITDPRRLREEVTLVRQQGYATDIEESDQNYTAYAVPITNRQGQCISAIAVALPLGRFQSTPAADLLGMLKEAANAIGRELPLGR